MTSVETLTDDEFEDQPDDALDLSQFDFRLLLHPVVLRTMVGIGVALLILLWPERTDDVLSRLLGIGLLVAGATVVWQALWSPPRRLLDAGLGLLAIGVGVVLLAIADRSTVVLGRLLGAVLLLVAARELLRLWFDDADRGSILGRSAVAVVLGSLLIAFPEQLFTATVMLLAGFWITFAVMVISQSLHRGRSGIASYHDGREFLVNWLVERPRSADDRQTLYDKILYEGPHAERKIVRFFALMGFASVIGAMGIIVDSTAVVIGAMLIAPLMTPLMGTSISMVMGWPARLERSAAIAAGGVLWAILIAVVLGLIFETSYDVATNGQIQARILPTGLDLVIALAAGAAGAYGLSRPDVSDSLPGVAIAISLVPPLSVVGLSYADGEWTAGHGALLLFATNAVAVLAMGGVTFVLTGVTPVARLAESQRRTRTAMAGLIAVAGIVLGGLLLNGAEVTASAFERSEVEAGVDHWLESYPLHDAVDVTVSEGDVTAIVVGPSADQPSARDLADELAERLGREVTVRVRLVVEERDTATSGETASGP